MRKIVFILLSFLCMTAGAQKMTSAQKKAEKARITTIKNEIANAKANLKSNKNLDKSEAALRNLLLKDSANMKDIRIHETLLETIKKQYQNANDKLFLRQLSDTAQIFQIAQRMFIQTAQLDSIDMLPNPKGIVAPRYRKANASFLSQYVKNIYGGIIFYVSKQKWNEATQLADLYLSLSGWPLFEGVKLRITPERTYHAAYLNLMAGYRNNKYDLAMKYADLAMMYESRLESSLQFISSMMLAKGDSAEYVNKLTCGLEEFPTSQFFYPRLIDYYISKGDNNKALEVTEKVLSVDSLEVNALVARQTIQLNMAHYDDCISQGEFILSHEKELFRENNMNMLGEVNYNVAVAYYNKSTEIQRSSGSAKEKNRKLVRIYKQCRPYAERFRQLAPKDVERWKPILYNIYLNLNLGKEFAEIERL